MVFGEAREAQERRIRRRQWPAMQGGNEDLARGRAGPQRHHWKLLQRHRELMEQTRKAGVRHRQRSTTRRSVIGGEEDSDRGVD